MQFSFQQLRMLECCASIEHIGAGLRALSFPLWASPLTLFTLVRARLTLTLTLSLPLILTRCCASIISTLLLPARRHA